MLCYEDRRSPNKILCYKYSQKNTISDTRDQHGMFLIKGHPLCEGNFWYFLFYNPNLNPFHSFFLSLSILFLFLLSSIHHPAIHPITSLMPRAHSLRQRTHLIDFVGPSGRLRGRRQKLRNAQPFRQRWIRRPIRPWLCKCTNAPLRGLCPMESSL